MRLFKSLIHYVLRHNGIMITIIIIMMMVIVMIITIMITVTLKVEIGDFYFFTLSLT